MKMFVILITLVSATSIAEVCYTWKQLKDNECKTYCHLTGYTSGVYVDKCWCANPVEEEILQEKKLLLPHKRSKLPYHFTTPSRDEERIVPFKLSNFVDGVVD